jgi:hypothetical protein
MYPCGTPQHEDGRVCLGLRVTQDGIACNCSSMADLLCLCCACGLLLHPTQVGLPAPGMWSLGFLPNNSQCYCQPSTFCCGTSPPNHQCNDHYQSMEGGPGYWTAQLPKKSAKFRLGLVADCYKIST